MSTNDGHIRDVARLFRILGDGTRLRILMELQKGQLNVGQLCRKLDLPQPTVSHHLGLLRLGSIVSARRDGKEIYYSLYDPDKHPYADSVKAFLKKAQAVRLGPVVVGMH